MKDPDILEALQPVINAFNNLSIIYYISGSIASSVYGIARATMDIDLVADIKKENISSLIKMLENIYYIDKDMIDDAIYNSSSFNIIHLDTMLKIDVFIHKVQLYQNEIFKRRQKDTLEESEYASEFYFSSPEDIILNKLKWYDGNRVSERQWYDVIGIIKVQGEKLDLGYLKKWGKYLRLSNLVEKAFIDAGASL